MLRRTGGILCLMLILSGGAYRLSAAETAADHPVRVEIIPEVTSLHAARSFSVALRFSMKPGWHIYWGNPGDSGQPASFHWSLPEGFAAEPVFWPVPERIVQPPLVSYGYEGEVFLFQKMNVPRALENGKPYRFEVRADWLVCQVDCIPGREDFEFTLEAEDKLPEVDFRWADAFRRMSSRLPAELDEAVTLRVSRTSQHLMFQILLPETARGKIMRLQFFPCEASLIQHAAGQEMSLIPGGLLLKVPLSMLAPKSLERVRGLLVADPAWPQPGSPRGVTVDLPLSEDSPTPADLRPAVRSPMNFLTAILFSFLGGLMLNLMPCVLPVLSLKIIGLTQSARTPSAAKKQGLAYGAGVLALFWLLALLILIFRRTGQAVGWGFQMQSPLFVTFLAVLFFVLALSLFGIFEIPLTVTPHPSGHKKKYVLWEAFAGGALATLVATPCTAPMMGAALGFALTQPAISVAAVFTSLGAGMALPYILLSFYPQALRWLPKPGAWMIALKQFFAFPMLATVLWLSWVLGIQTGVNAVTRLFAGLWMIGFALWGYGKVQSIAGRLTRRVLVGVVCGSLIAGFFVLFPMRGLSGDKTSSAADSVWETYSEDKLAVYRASGRPVFLDFTAAWCLTCQVNERVALENPKVIKRMRELGIVPMKADWTSYDAGITKALESHGRSSIPLYVFYPANGGLPLILPEVLTPDIVLNFLNKLKTEDNTPHEAEP